MRQSIIDLCSILQEEIEVVAETLNLAKQEQDIIVAGEAGNLENIIKLEIKQLNKLGQLEKQRTELHKVFALEMGVSEEETTISRILESSDQNEKLKLAPIQEELRALVTQHTAVNAENRELIKAHMEYSDTMLGLMVGAEDPLNNMYGGDGRAKDERRKSTGFYDGHA